MEGQYLDKYVVCFETPCFDTLENAYDYISGILQQLNRMIPILEGSINIVYAKDITNIKIAECSKKQVVQHLEIIEELCEKVISAKTSYEKEGVARKIYHNADDALYLIKE